MIYCAIPAYGRLPLLKVTIERLSKQTVPVKVIVMGDEADIWDMCKKMGIHFIQVPNIPLGHKWQTGIDYCKKQADCEAFLYLGSSDWISNNWCEVMLKHLDGGYHMAGVEDIYFLDIQKYNHKQMLYWPGYVGEREGETIGTGRMLSRKGLDLIGWDVFDRELHNSLDACMMNRLWRKRAKVKVDDKSNIFCLSLSTYKWENKHQFRDMSLMGHVERMSHENMEELIKKIFPEAEDLFQEEAGIKQINVKHEKR
jgi:glycosyltransferase involved in cell wall biosynthesis